MHLVGGMFASALVVGACVPLYLSGQRHADTGVRRARMQEMARQITTHFREDVRQATTAEVGDGGRLLRLSLPRVTRAGAPDVVVYRYSALGLQREVRPGAGSHGAERALYPAPLVAARFAREGRVLRADLELRETFRSRVMRLDLSCTATPRSGP
jgi:hypothetical protein